MQIIFAVLRLAAAIIGVWLVSLFLLSLVRHGNPDAVVAVPFAAAIEEIPPGPYIQENAFDPAAKSLSAQLGNKSFEELVREGVVSLAASILKALAKLTDVDVLVVLLGAIAGSTFGLTFDRLRNVSFRRVCSTHLYLMTIKASYNLLDIMRSATITQDGRWLLPGDVQTNAVLHRLRADLDAISDFSVAYQNVFTRPARLHAVPARMSIAPVRAIVDLAIADIERAPSVSIDLNTPRFKAVMLYRGRNVFVRLWHAVLSIIRRIRGQAPVHHPEDPGFLANVFLIIAAGAAIELNFQLAERLEGRHLFVFPPSGRVLPRSTRMQHLRPIRKLWRAEQFPVFAQRLLKGTSEPWPPVPDAPALAPPAAA